MLETVVVGEEDGVIRAMFNLMSIALFIACLLCEKRFKII